MEELSVFNCSVQNEHVKENLKYFNNNVLPLGTPLQKVAGFGIFSGLFIAVLFELVLKYKHLKLQQSHNIKIDKEKTLSRAALLLLLTVLLPITVMFLSLAVLYKCLCCILIKNGDKNFVRFLDNFDVFWSLEDDVSRSIINVLGVVESDSPQALLEHIKDKLQSIIPNADSEKIFYRRSEEYGFYYWRKCPYIDIDQYVRIVDVCNCYELTKSDLQEVMSEISYQPLPYNDEGLFQILITNQRVVGDNSKDEYAIIFRIHHSIGDGVALVEFLCYTLADEQDMAPSMFCMPEMYNDRRGISVLGLIKMIVKLCEMPICLVDGILRKPDENSLHGPILLGKKIYKWKESDDNLFCMVKEIKDTAAKLNFSDILATALSCGLKEYFIQKGVPVPENVAVILPIRFPNANNNLANKLENNFTVSILDVPINGDENDVKNNFTLLRNSADPMTNYYFLKICGVLPKEILHPMFNSSQATMVLSNMPGPKELRISGGVLKSLVFFVPNKGNTGLGVTALCYGGILRFAAMADAALVSKPDDLGIILDGMEDEIKRLHKKYVNN